MGRNSDALSVVDLPSVEKRILTSARKQFRIRKGLTAVYEHGHWWVIIDRDYTVRTYDVVDGVIYGEFGFELVDEYNY